MPNRIHIRHKSDFLDNLAQVQLGCHFDTPLNDTVASLSQLIRIDSALGQIRMHDQ